VTPEFLFAYGKIYLGIYDIDKLDWVEIFVLSSLSIIYGKLVSAA
jgi:hypothetical protein